MASVDIPTTFGALLLGGLFSSLLSGVVSVQGVVYFKVYPDDTTRLKGLVLFIWALDLCHSAFVWSALWQYLINLFGAAQEIDVIPWTLALTICLTAVLTFFVHCFFAQRIFMLSKHNTCLTLPIVILATLRLAFACATTAEMIRAPSFRVFLKDFNWLFTVGLSLSTGVDILITCSLFLLLQTSRTGGARLDILIDALIRYTFETGSLTCAGTMVSMVCYLTMRTNLIFMGLHFVISKLYANSLLVTLNTRQRLRYSRSLPSSPPENPVSQFSPRRPMFSMPPMMSLIEEAFEQRPIGKVEINVERSVEYELDPAGKPQ